MRHKSERTLVTMTLPPRPESISTARAALKPLLTHCPFHSVEAVLLVTSELVTNAIRHARTTLRLEVRATDQSVTVVVTDERPMKQPQLRPPLADPLAPDGRGLVLVDRLSDAWGFTSDGSTKRVWAEMACR